MPGLNVGSALINLISTKGETAFEKQWSTFKALIESVEPQSWPQFHERHAMLRIAALRGRVEAVQLLLDPLRKPEVDDRQPETGKTALHEAAFNAHVTIVEMLLEHEATVDLLAAELGESALHCALSRPRFRNPRPPTGLEETVRALLDAGANPNLSNLHWQTPVHYAARNSHSNILKLLLGNPGNHGSRNRDDKAGNTPLHIAALMGHVDEVDVLLGHSAVHMNTANKRQETPLYLAATHTQANEITEWSKHDDTVRLLLERGADTTQQKIHGLAMLDWAASDNGKSNAANLILRKEYSSWQASWFQEPDAPWYRVRPPEGLDHDIAKRLFKASAMWLHLRYDTPDAVTGLAVDHSKCHSCSVEDMVYKEANFSKLFEQVNPNAKEGFMWFNIPENNMQWVLDLHYRICRDKRGSESDAGQIDVQSFIEWFYASQPHKFAPQLREDVHYGSKRSIRNISISIPYLSVESHERRWEYEHAVQGYPRNTELSSEACLLRYKHLISAYGSEYDNGLLRKTLDKYRYHDLRQTTSRDASQVILRASQARNLPDEHDLEQRLLQSAEFDGFRSQWWPRDNVPSGEPDDLPMRGGDGDVLMVDQACIWVLGDDTIITSFPSSFKEKSMITDPLTRILAYLDEPNRPPITSVLEFAAFVTLHCTTIHTPSWTSSFNAIIDMTTDLQVGHFKNFIRSSRIVDNANEYRKSRARREELARAEDDLTSIQREVKNLCEVTDIQDELHIIDKVLHEQSGVVAQLVAVSSAPQPRNWPSSRLQLQHASLQQALRASHVEVQKMLDNAQRTHAAILQLLDLKQQQASVSEARTARQQSAATARQNDTVQLFTFVTIIFAPASFLVAFFAVPGLALPGLDTTTLKGAVGAIVVFSTIIWVPIVAYVVFADHVRDWLEHHRSRKRSAGLQPYKGPGGWAAKSNGAAVRGIAARRGKVSHV